MAVAEVKNREMLENAYYKLNVVSLAIGRFSDPGIKLTKQEAMGLRVITQEVISILEGCLGKGGEEEIEKEK
jgi:hypothetical protein